MTTVHATVASRLAFDFAWVIKTCGISYVQVRYLPSTTCLFCQCVPNVCIFQFKPGRGVWWCVQ